MTEKLNKMKNINCLEVKDSMYASQRFIFLENIIKEGLKYES